MPLTEDKNANASPGIALELRDGYYVNLALAAHVSPIMSEGNGRYPAIRKRHARSPYPLNPKSSDLINPERNSRAPRYSYFFPLILSHDSPARHLTVLVLQVDEKALSQWAIPAKC